MAFVQTKKVYILLGLLVVGGGLVYRYYRARTAPPSYETVAIARETLVQTVEATGKIEAVDDLDLRFEIPGTVGNIGVREGQQVKTGTILGSLNMAELNAAVAQATANLNQKLAPSTKEDQAYYLAAVMSAKASLEETKVASSVSVAKAEAVVATAKNNLRLAEGGDNSQIVAQEYESAAPLLQAALTKLDDALTQADNILGIDNTFANEAFKAYLSVQAPEKLNQANTLYSLVKNERIAARNQISILTTASSHADIDSALTTAEIALAKMSQLLALVSEVLKTTVPVGNLTQAALDTKKTTIETARTTITTQYTTVVTKRQGIVNAKNSLSAYTIAYEKALRELDQARSDADNAIKIKQAGYDQALANYQTKINPPREVDIAPYRAALSQALANRDKAILRSPNDGLIAKINKKKGEFVASNEVMFKLISPHFKVEIDIPETDVPKLKIGQTAEITLDAFGTDRKFIGRIDTIDIASTEIQDVVYYRVTVRIEDAKAVEMKAGMTANILVKSATRENTLVIPFRTVRSAGDRKYVILLENGAEKETDIELGLRGSDGRVEVTKGLVEGQVVVVSKEDKGKK